MLPSRALLRSSCVRAFCRRRAAPGKVRRVKSPVPGERAGAPARSKGDNVNTKSLYCQPSPGPVEESVGGIGPLLELISGPAYVIDSQGVLVLSNEVGHSALERDPRLGREIFDAAQGRLSDRIESVRTLGRGTRARLFIVVMTSDPPNLEGRFRAAAHDSHLSEAEGKVLRHLVRGDANKDIAAKLDCSVRTVEVHVTAILSKCRVDSRSRLIAWFWTR